ncbi:MAG: sel1 repeat family protein [Prevotella sp.]|nr:sel1 repeat family protein [Prevotella sp.]
MKPVTFEVNGNTTGVAILIENTRKNKNRHSEWKADASSSGEDANALVAKGNECFANADYPQAARYYQQAADLNNPSGQAYLGMMYEYGQGVEANAEKAVALYQKAADQNLADAQFFLAYCYLDGTGVTPNAQTALSWAKKAADQNHAGGKYAMGYIYSANTPVQDFQKALYWYHEAEKMDYAMAYNDLGWMYENGYGITRDMRTAFDYYTKGAENDIAGSMRHLGEFYENGWVVSRNMSTAIEWYKKAANLGNKKAQQRLEELKQQAAGGGSSQLSVSSVSDMAALKQYNDAKQKLAANDISGALVHFSIASKADSQQLRQRALLQIGRIYYEARNDSKAFIYFCMAARDGSREARFFIGQCLEKGRGIQQNVTEAQKSYQKSGYSSLNDVLRVMNDKNF